MCTLQAAKRSKHAVSAARVVLSLKANESCTEPENSEDALAEAVRLLRA
jgi:hypothetical protein